MPDQQEPRIGQQIGEYRLVSKLGDGSFGTVYLAEHVHEHTQAAIKVFDIRLNKRGDLKDFINEASMMMRLRHLHIVPLLNFGVNRDDLPFLVMEYAPEGTLRDRHPEGERIPLLTIVSYVDQLASALQYAHDHRVIHRDVKSHQWSTPARSTPQKRRLGRRFPLLVGGTLGLILFLTVLVITIRPILSIGPLPIPTQRPTVSITHPDQIAQKWAFLTGASVQSSPIVVDGVLYVGSTDSRVYALNASTGQQIWTFLTGASVYSSPTVVDGVLYVSSIDSRVYALNASTGQQIWTLLFILHVPLSTLLLPHHRAFGHCWTPCNSCWYY